MKYKQFIIFGLGRYGTSVAKQLEHSGCKVLAIDYSQEKINKISDYVTLALKLDVTKEEALAEIGSRNFDGAIESLGKNMEAAIYATMWVKEQRIPLIIANAYDEMQGRILKKLGADQIIYPEQDMGIQLANNLSFDNMFDSIQLTTDYSIFDFEIPNEWIGKKLKELKLRDKYDMNVVAVKHHNRMKVTPDADKPLQEKSVLVMIGHNTMITKLKEEYQKKNK